MSSDDPPTPAAGRPDDDDDRVARLERAVANASDGFWERALSSGKTWYSQSMLALFDVTQEEVDADAEALVKRLHPDDREAFTTLYENAIRRTSIAGIECRYLNAQKQWRWLRCRMTAWRGADGRSERISGTVTDIHEQHRTVAELEAAVAERTRRLETALAEAEQRRIEAVRATEAKSRFLAHMSHEMRTPLNGVLGLTDLALRASQNVAQRRHLEVALQSGKTLRQVIDDVLEMSRLEAGMPALVEAPFDLADSLAEVVRGVVPLMRHKPIVMLFDWLGDASRVRGDAARVRQLVTNLLANAAKFTDSGHIALVGEMSAAPDGSGVATIRIDDSGPGIAPDQIGHLFDAFVQGDASLSRRHGGTGLGLAIARGLARQMGGDVSVDSQLGSGSAFIVRLPFASVSSGGNRGVWPPGLVWLVSPHPNSAPWLARRLERLGWKVEVLPSVDAAVTAAVAASGGSAGTMSSGSAAWPAVLLLPEAALLAGIDLQALATALPRTRLWMLLRPDWQNMPLEAQAQALGIGQMVTPLAPRDLQRLLTDPPSTTPVQPACAADIVMDGDGHVLLVEDNAINRLIAEEYLKTLGLPVRTADDGAMAVQACQDHPPRLVLMDLQMPVMDGLEATRRLRALQRDGRLPAFPIVALTAHAMAADREEASIAGMDDYLTKPILLETLRQALARWVPMSPAS